jgi:hypothetical protein
VLPGAKLAEDAGPAAIPTVRAHQDRGELEEEEDREVEVRDRRSAADRTVPRSAPEAETAYALIVPDRFPRAVEAVSPELEHEGASCA